jgi:hypothetical protein
MVSVAAADDPVKDCDEIAALHKKVLQSLNQSYIVHCNID